MPKARTVKAKSKGAKAVKSVASPEKRAEMPTRLPVADFLASKKWQKRENHSKKKLERKAAKKGISLTCSSHMSALEMSLQDATSSDASSVVAPAVIKAAVAEVQSNKFRKQVAVREVGRMRLVLEHPAFVEDPWGSVHSHLRHVLRAKQGLI